MNTQNFPKLKGRENYQTWAISAKSYLTVKDLWKYTQSVPDDKTTDPVKLLYEKTLAELTLLIEPKCYSYIEGAENPKSAWDLITKTFSDNGVTRHSQILQELVTMKRSKCSSMEDYVEKMTVLYQKTKACGFEIGENVVASLMLGGLSEEYKPLMYGVGKDSKNLTLDFVQNLLLQEIDSNCEVADESALAAGSKKFSRSNKKIKCYNCGGNHFAKHCKKEKKKDKRTDKSSHSLLCVKFESDSDDEASDDSLFFYNSDNDIEENQCNELNDKKDDPNDDEKSSLDETCNISTFFVSENKREWILDSGATAHMCNDEKNIQNARPPQKRTTTQLK